MTTALLLDHVDLPAALRGSEALSALTETERRELAALMTVVTLADGDQVIRQGAACETLYLVLSGTVAVSARDRGGLMLPVEEVGPGNLVGDMGMFLRAPAAATSRARGDVRLGALSKEALDGFSD